MPETHFFLAGAQRSGTSYLCQALDEHPQVEMAKPFRPEPKFFSSDRLYEMGIECYQSQFFSENKAPAVLRRGEKSTSYMESPAAIERISRDFSGADILFLLRNPVDRAISNVRFSQASGFEDLPLEKALLRELESPELVITAENAGTSVSPQSYLARSRYVQFLQLFARRFPKRQLHIFLTDNVVGVPAGIASVYEVLGVDPGFLPSMHGSKVNESASKNDGISAELRLMLDQYFANDNRNLAEEFAVDLSAWLQ